MHFHLLFDRCTLYKIIKLACVPALRRAQLAESMPIHHKSATNVIAEVRDANECSSRGSKPVRQHVIVAAAVKSPANPAEDANAAHSQMAMNEMHRNIHSTNLICIE